MSGVKLTADERHLLLWKDGKTFVAPPHWALPGCREKGLVTEGDILSSNLTPAGRAALSTKPTGGE